MQQFQTMDQNDLNDRMLTGGGRTRPPRPSPQVTYQQMGGHLAQSYPNMQAPGLDAAPQDVYAQSVAAGQPQYLLAAEPPLGTVVAPLAEAAAEDFVLMDVVGGGCASQVGSTGLLSSAARSISVHHPSKPVVAYTAGCMIIVYDLLSDSKVNLMGHKHNVYALAFTPNGQQLMSVDFDRDAEIHNTQLAEGELPDSSSSISLWDWQRGVCLQSAKIPRASSLSEALIVNQSAAMMFGPTMAGAAPVRDFTIAAAKSTQSCFIQISFEKSGALFMILESSPLEVGGGYRVTLWSFNKQQVMEMISSMDLELQNPCIELGVLPRTQSEILNAQRSAGQTGHSAQVFLHSKLPFFTAERQCIKLWEYSQGNAQLKKRIHIKQAICSVMVSELTNFLLILGESGKLLILDQEGEFVSTVARDGVVFTRIGTAHDKLLLGTNRGTVHVYHMASLQFINEIPYQLSFLEKFSLNSYNKTAVEIDQLSLAKVGPPVTEIGTTLNLRYLWLRYSDGSFVMIDRTIMNPKQAILGYSCGHFESISAMQWIAPKSSFDMVSRAGGFSNLPNRLAPYGSDFQLDGLQNQGTGSQISNHELQFITCAHDLSVHLWRHYGDRWAFSYIDIAKSFDQSLSFQRKQCDRSTREMKLTALCVYPRSNNLIVGDNKGYIRVFQLVNENAHLISTHKLQRAREAQTQGALGITPGNPLGAGLAVPGTDYSDNIKEIHITKNEQVAVVTFDSGNVSLYDTKNGFALLGDAVESDFQKFNTQYSDHEALSIQAKIIEVTVPSHGGQAGNSLKDRLQMYKKYQPGAPQQDEQPFGASNVSQHSDFENSRRNNGSVMNSSLIGAHGTSLKVLTLASPNQVSMQLVDVKGSRLARSKLSQFVISEGKVTGFDVHPSNDYLLVTSSRGRIYVFRIDTGELRGTIKVPLNSAGCQVDPSGLYVVIKVPAFASQNTYNLMQDGGAAAQERAGHFASNQKEFERNTILMYEIGTGMPAAEISSIFEVSQLRFAPDGQYLALGSTNGTVCVWSMGNHLHQNVKQVLDAMKMSSDFWFNYPIFLPDYEQFNNNLGQLPQDEVQAYAQPAQDIATTTMIPPQYNPVQQPTSDPGLQVANQLASLEGAASQSAQSAPQNQPYQQQVQVQDAQAQPQRPTGADDLAQAQQLPAHYIQLPPQYPQAQTTLPAQGNPYAAGANAAQASQAQANWQALSMPGQAQARAAPHQVTPQGNEQRFLRRTFTSNQPGAAQRQQMQLSNLLQSQRNTNNLLYQGGPSLGGAVLPPNYQPVWQPAQQAAQPQQPMTYLSQSERDYPQPGAQQARQQTLTPQFSPQPQQQALPAGAQGTPYEAYVPRPPSGFTQKSAQEALLGIGQGILPSPARAPAQPGVTEQANAPDLNEPVPFNQSQLLYNQPLTATVKGTEGLAKSNGFEKYADMNAVGPVGSGEKAYVLRPPNVERALKTAFDGSLNDRDGGLGGTLVQEGTTRQPNQFGASKNLKLQSAIEEEHKKLLAAQQQRAPSPNQTLRAQNPLIESRDVDTLQRQTMKTEPQQFHMTGFSNTQTQQDILKSNAAAGIAGRGSLQPDPVDIDGVGAGPTGGAPAKVMPPSTTNQMVEELDSLNKYLAGVRVPGAFQGRPAVTLQNMRQPQPAPGNKVSQLYQAAARAPPGQSPAVVSKGLDLGYPNMIPGPGSETGAGSYIRGSNQDAADVRDELFQNIDDFEEKLGQLRKLGSETS